MEEVEEKGVVVHHNSEHVFVRPERLKQTPPDPQIPTAANKIINFQLEGVPKTSCQLLLALSEDSHTIRRRIRK